MTLFSDDFDAFFASAITVLQPYLNDIVCIGGCANALYRYHDNASDVLWGFLGTKDIDFAVPQKLSAKDRPLVSTLMENIGFTENLCGIQDDAVVKYSPKNDDSPMDLEFLCDMSGLSKMQKQKAAIQIQKGMHAQPLRYLGMMLHNTWQVQLSAIPGFNHLKSIRVRIPNPAAYIVSKVLIRSAQRSLDSMQKDCFYIYEVSVVFRDAFNVIRKEYDLLEACVPKWKDRFSTDARNLFTSVTSEGAVSAVQVYRDLGELQGQNFDVTEEMVSRSVTLLLDAILG
ncbi:nucleotidyltransferase domain-containing protein [bacterium]|nr:nucleotidyltransferase domain-containing protein [bacterium]